VSTHARSGYVCRHMHAVHMPYVCRHTLSHELYVMHTCRVQAWATADKTLWAGKAEEANRLVDAAKLSAENES